MLRRLIEWTAALPSLVFFAAIVAAVTYGSYRAVFIGLEVGFNQQLAMMLNMALSNADAMLSSAFWIIAKVCGMLCTLVGTAWIVHVAIRKVWYGY